MFVIIALMLALPAGGSAQEPGPTGNTTVYLPITFRQIPPPAWIGPYGGKVMNVAFNAQNPAVVYAATYDGTGVFKSTNGGATWASCPQNPGNLAINVMAIDPVDPNILYAGPYKDPGKFYKTIDGCNSWFQISNGIQDGATAFAIAVDPQNHNNVYVATRGIIQPGTPPNYNGIIYRSTDGGQNWQVSLTGIGYEGANPFYKNKDGVIVGYNDYVYSIAIDPLNPSIVYAASHEHGPYKSTDFGKTWNFITTGISDGSGRAIVVDPVTPATLYFGVWHQTGVFKSTNGGGNWYTANNNLGNEKIINLSIAPNNPQTLYTGGFYPGDLPAGVFKTTNGGSKWFNTGGIGGIKVYQVGIHPNNNAALLAATWGNGIYASNDAGENWYSSTQGLSTLLATGLAVQPGGSAALLAATSNAGAYRSTDQGASWSAYNAGLGDLHFQALVPDPGNPNRIFGLTGSAGLYWTDLSTASGWTSVSAGLPSVTTAAAAGSEAQPLNRFAVPIDPVDAELHGEGGVSAAAVSAIVPLLSMEFSRSNPNVAYLGTQGKGVYRSTNGGASWGYLGLSGKSIRALAVDPNDANRVYAATGTAGQVDFYNGSAWSTLALPNGAAPYELAISPVDAGSVYAGTTTGVYKGVGGGGFAPAGLSGMDVTALLAHPGRAGVVYAGTRSNGAFVTTDGGATWSPGPGELVGFGIQAIRIDPNDSHWVYFGTVRGVMRAYFP